MRLSPAWTYVVAGAIWRVSPDGSGHLIGEERDPERRAVAFFCLNATHGTVLWEHLRMDDEWWVGIEAVHAGVVFFHGFATPDLPGHKGITAVDIASGKRLWSRRDLRFLTAHRGSCYASHDKGHETEILELDTGNGSVLGYPAEETIPSPRSSAVGGASDMSIRFPHPMSPEEWEQPELGGVVRFHTQSNEVIGDVNVLIHPRGSVFHWIEQVKGNGNIPPHNRSVLNVVDASGRTLVFSDLVGGGNTVQASFFTDHDMLLYLKRRDMLSAVHLML